jgi:hypothetical protein
MADAPEFPTLLGSYVVRPAWQVAGVDYYVGAPGGTALKDPSAISMAGVSINGHELVVSGDNVVLDGYNFNGWNVYVTGSNLTIQNSSFKVNADSAIPVDAIYGGFVTLLHDTFDGGGIAGATPNVAFRSGTGGAFVEHNQFTNFANDAINIVNDGNITIKYNLFDHLGFGGFHADAIQSFFSSVSKFDVEYNTMYEPAGPAGAGGINSFMRIGDQGADVVNNPVMAFNTLIFQNSGGSANAFQLYPGTAVGTLTNPVVHDNFIDPTKITYAITFLPLDSGGGVVNPTTYGNVDMTTGHAILDGPYNSRTANIPSNPPPAPVITAVADSMVTGTGPVNDAIDVYDKGTLLGSTLANSSGAWSLTNSSLGSGGHTLTARATDAYANTSGASEVVTVGIGGAPQEFFH